MLVNVADKTFVVNFNYGVREAEKGIPTQTVTRGWIRPHGRPRGVDETTAFAVCSSKDVFKKAEGRKRVVAKLLNAAGFSRSDRTLFWKNYFAQTKSV